MNFEDLKNSVANLTVPSLPFADFVQEWALTQAALRRQIGDPESAEW